MKTFLITCLLWSFSLIGWSQKPTNLMLEGQIFGTSSNRVYITRGVSFNGEVIDSFALDEKGFFKDEIQLPAPDFYILNLEDGQRIHFFVEQDDTLKIYGDGGNLFHYTNIVGNEEVTEMIDFMKISAEYRVALDSANQHLQSHPEDRNEIRKQFAPIYKNYTALRNQYIKTQSTSPAIIAVMGTINLENEWETYEFVVNSLEKSFPESQTVQNMLLEYKDNKKMMMAKNPTAVGNMALDIALPNPEGDTMRLSDYKGKIVLLDFWASWCRPCRMANPHVVELYHTYKDQGFEVFSVSLDRTKSAWVKAIEQDKLVWDGHVSDLKFWQSSAAQLYNVHSIPTTVLIDKEGKIIATNLRGEALSNKLKEIFE